MLLFYIPLGGMHYIAAAFVFVPNAVAGAQQHPCQ
jgi:hypothetical protein